MTIVMMRINMKDRNTNLTFTSLTSSNIGLIIFIVFLILKLVGVIEWSWFYVTLPLWVPVALNTLIITLIIIIFVIKEKVKEHIEYKNFKKYN
jgi:membrane protein YdbS with pleckstrin-like domain